MNLLDFEGDYGRTYDTHIEGLIPAYSALFEIAAATATALQARAQRVLVVGPGSGTELPGLLAAMPEASFTLVEPSAQMRGQCQALIDRIGAGARVQWAELEPLEEGGFEAVISHNVLHVLAPDTQAPLLEQLVRRVGPGGILLLSSYSETPALPLPLAMAIATARFRALGMDEPTVQAVMASRNSKVFSLDHALLERTLHQAGLEPPTQLLQALFTHLWLSRRPPLQCEGGADA